MSPFSCIVEEYHDNVAWCHSGRNSLKQGGYCSKMKQGGVGHSDCAMNSMENRMITSTYWRLWKKIKTELDIYDGFSSQHIGNISSLLLSVNSFCMCSQILIDFLIMFDVFV